MTKTELVEKINEIHSKIEELEISFNTLIDEIVNIRRKTDELPTEADEIDDDEPE